MDGSRIGRIICCTKLLQRRTNDGIRSNQIDRRPPPFFNPSAAFRRPVNMTTFSTDTLSMPQTQCFFLVSRVVYTVLQFFNAYVQSANRANAKVQTTKQSAYLKIYLI